MQTQIKLPKEFTEEHRTLEYYNKLIGKRVSDNRMINFIHDKIIGALSVSRRTPKQDFPDTIRYKTETGEMEIDWLVMVKLIEGGYAVDTFGFTYRLVG